MLDRRIGLETEYALRFSPERAPPGRHPGNHQLFRAMIAALEGTSVLTAPGKDDDTLFLENGGKINWECISVAQMFWGLPAQSGLLEASTPECRGPVEALLFQRAQDRLLGSLAEPASSLLDDMGFTGELSILKNCKDPEGDFYGSQENYEVVVARGLSLWIWRAALVVMMPFFALAALSTWTWILAVGVVLAADFSWRALAELFAADDEDRAAFDDGDAVFGASGEVRPTPFFRFAPSLARHIAGHRRWGPRAERWMQWVLHTIHVPLAWPLKSLAFRRERRRLESFFLTRVLLSGAGHVDDDGRFLLSEKGSVLSHMNVSRADRPGVLSFFDLTNLTLLPAQALCLLQFRELKSVFRRRQRMQIGMGDGNLCDTAELLKLGSTALLLDLCDADLLRDAPLLRDPVQAFHRINADPDLEEQLELLGGGTMSALEIQRWFLEQARAFVSSQVVTSVEAGSILKSWEHALDALDATRAPARTTLFGRLDWVTKRALLDEAGPVLGPRGTAPGFATAKKIDVRYHELDTGYHAQLDDEGLVTRLTSRDDALEWMKKAPDDVRARHRTELIRSLAGSPQLQVDWHAVRVGSGRDKKIVFLDDHRS